MAKKTGRGKIELDLKQVESLAAQGLTKEQIALALGIGTSTLYDRQNTDPEFLEAVKRGQALGVAKVVNALFQGAMSGNTTAQIFYLKNRAGWADKQETDMNISVPVISIGEDVLG